VAMDPPFNYDYNTATIGGQICDGPPVQLRLQHGDDRWTDLRGAPAHR
jgi:hypothetical protein